MKGRKASRQAERQEEKERERDRKTERENVKKTNFARFLIYETYLCRKV